MSTFTIKEGESVQEIAVRAKKANVAIVFSPYGEKAIKTLVKVGTDIYLEIPSDLQALQEDLDLAKLRESVTKEKYNANGKRFFLNANSATQVDALIG